MEDSHCDEDSLSLANTELGGVSTKDCVRCGKTDIFKSLYESLPALLSA